MATLQEVYDGIVSDDAERTKFVEAACVEGGIESFLAERGCDATAEEMTALIIAQADGKGGLSDEELDGVAGGFDVQDILGGVGNAATAAVSTAMKVLHGGNGSALCQAVLNG